MNRETYGFLHYYIIEVFKSTSLLYMVSTKKTVSDDENVQQEDLQIFIR